MSRRRVRKLPQIGLPLDDRFELVSPPGAPEQQAGAPPPVPASEQERAGQLTLEDTDAEATED